MPTATEASGTAYSGRRVGHAGPVPVLWTIRSSASMPMAAPSKNLPDSIQVRSSDGLNFRFFNLTDRYELICGGSRGQPNEFWNLQHLT